MKPVYQARFVSALNWDQIPGVTMTHAPWLTPNLVSAQAKVCYDRENLYVRLEAVEDPIRATLSGPLDPICQDSCLEFFFAPLEGDHRYFNFEFNPLGGLYLGFGGPRATRVRQITKDPKGLFDPVPFFTPVGWGITFRVPLEFIRMYVPQFAFEGSCGCNFYKCGDETESPHFLAWSPLSSSTPDFHRRQDFGVLTFAPAP